MSERLDRIEALLNRMAERQMAHDTRFERIETQLGEINAALDRVVQGQSRNEAQIGQNAEAISELRGIAANVNQRVEILEQVS